MNDVMKNLYQSRCNYNVTNDLHTLIFISIRLRLRFRIRLELEKFLVWAQIQNQIRIVNHVLNLNLILMNINICKLMMTLYMHN